MIGLPTNFRHTTHVGKDDAHSAQNVNLKQKCARVTCTLMLYLFQVDSLQRHMSSKGGYDCLSADSIDLSTQEDRQP